MSYELDALLECRIDYDKHLMVNIYPIILKDITTELKIKLLYGIVNGIIPVSDIIYPLISLCATEAHLCVISHILRLSVSKHYIFIKISEDTYENVLSLSERISPLSIVLIELLLSHGLKFTNPTKFKHKSSKDLLFDEDLSGSVILQDLDRISEFCSDSRTKESIDILLNRKSVSMDYKRMIKNHSGISFENFLSSEISYSKLVYDAIYLSIKYYNVESFKKVYSKYSNISYTHTHLLLSQLKYTYDKKQIILFNLLKSIYLILINSSFKLDNYQLSFVGFIGQPSYISRYISKYKMAFSCGDLGHLDILLYNKEVTVGNVDPREISKSNLKIFSVIKKMGLTTKNGSKDKIRSLEEYVNYIKSIIKLKTRLNPNLEIKKEGISYMYLEDGMYKEYASLRYVAELMSFI